MKIATYLLSIPLLLGFACSREEPAVRWKLLVIEKSFSHPTGALSLALVGDRSWTSSISAPLSTDEVRTELGDLSPESMADGSEVVNLVVSENQGDQLVYRLSLWDKEVLSSVLIDKGSEEVIGRWDGIKQGCLADRFLFSEALNLYAWDAESQSSQLLQEGVSSVACSGGDAYCFKTNGEIVRLDTSTGKGESVASLWGVVTESSALPDGRILFYNSRTEKHLGSLKVYDPVAGKIRLIGRKWPRGEIVVLGEAS